MVQTARRPALVAQDVVGLHPGQAGLKTCATATLIPPVLLVLALVVLGAVPLDAENWPQWRGPLLNGVSAETNLPVRWSQTENIAWKLALPERSGSTPIVWGDRIFLNVAEGRNLWLWSVDRARGARPVETAARRRQHAEAKAEHVVALAGDRRPARVVDDRHRRDQGVRLRGHGALVARYSEGVRRIRAAVGLRVVAAAVRGFAVRAGAARLLHRRTVLRPAHQQGERQDHLARRAADAARGANRPTPTRLPRSCATAQPSRSSSPAATS